MDFVLIFLLILGGIVALYAIIYTLIYISKKDRDSSKEEDNIIEYDFSDSQELAGIKGEKFVQHFLNLLKKDDEYLLTNLLLPYGKNRKAEIDMVLITRKGVFCIEVKTWSGHISGNNDDKYWIQTFDDERRESKRHPNPVIQNEGHTDILYRLLNRSYQIDNVVIFQNLEDGSRIKSNYCYSLSQFMTCYKHYDNEITIEDVKSIYEKVKTYVGTPYELERHRNELQNRFKNRI